MRNLKAMFALPPLLFNLANNANVAGRCVQAFLVSVAPISADKHCFLFLLSVHLVIGANIGDHHLHFSRQEPVLRHLKD